MEIFFRQVQFSRFPGTDCSIVGLIIILRKKYCSLIKLYIIHTVFNKKYNLKCFSQTTIKDHFLQSNLSMWKKSFVIINSNKKKEILTSCHILSILLSLLFNGRISREVLVPITIPWTLPSHRDIAATIPSKPDYKYVNIHHFVCEWKKEQNIFLEGGISRFEK